MEVLAQEEWQSPYYWAAFSLTGEADEAKMASLTNTPEGEELAEEWGDDAAYNLAVAFAKIDAITENMSASDRDAISDWAGSLSDRETMAVLRGLAE